MADGTAETAMPSAIAQAIVKVMASLGTLAKANDNKFDKYMYASIDDFIQFVRSHCTDAGLFIITSEAETPDLRDMTKKDGKPLLMWWSRFAFTLGHTDGALFGPIYKTVMVQANGAQASGSAQSYALKQLMRGLFLIPTGDKDDPDKESADISTRAVAETDLQKKANNIRAGFRKAADSNELGLAWTDNSIDLDFIKRASETAYEFLLKEYKQRETELEKA